MSFVKTLATLAAGYAAAKGVDKYKDMGGMAGIKDQVATGEMSMQLGQMMEKMGIPEGAAKADQLMAMLGGAAAGNAGAAGMGGLMSAMTSAGAGGAEQTTKMIDSFFGGTQATDTMEDNAKLMIRAMIQAAKADGEIDDEERAKILDTLGDVDAAERAFVEAELAAPVDVMALANDVNTAAKAQVYAVSAMAIRIDSNAEAQYLTQLAQALGLSPDQVARIHQSMGIGRG